MVTVMDTVMAASRFTVSCRMNLLRPYALRKCARLAFERVGQQFGARACPAINYLAGRLKLAGALLTTLAATPLSAQNVSPAIPPVTSDVQSAVPATTPSFRVFPVVELGERYTDNATLATSAAQSDWVTDAAAGLGVEYRAARANALLDYRVNRLIYRQQSNLNSTQHLLSSRASLEAVEKWLFLDASASITQQNRSAFGIAGITDFTNTRANRVETTTYQLSPYVLGNFMDVTTYLLRVNGAETRAGESAFPDSRTYEWTGFVKNAPAARRLGWSVDGNSLSVRNSTVGRRQDSRLRASLLFEIDVQLRMSLGGGKESSDLDGRDRRATSTYGLGFEWTPSQRTQMAAITQRRFFGNDHLVAIAHRTARTAWRFSSAREIAVSTNELAASNPASANSVLLDLPSTVPDPNARLDVAAPTLGQTGMTAPSGIQGGFFTVRPFLSRRQEASMVMQGSRNTITIAVGRREQRAVDGSSVTPGSSARIEEFRQYGANAAWAYRLSPVSTLTTVVSRFRTEGLFSENLTTTQRLQSLFFVTRLGPRTSVSLGVRRVLFDSTVLNSNRENTFVSTLSVRF